MATKDFFAPPALSLSLAGIFRTHDQDREEESVGDGKRARDDDDIPTSDNSGQANSNSDDGLPSAANMEDEHHSTAKKKKKKQSKNYHRHSAAQIREMEALFKESPHPDEKQRQQLSRQLGLAPRQVKFWFQNRRTQIKAIQERHENSLLRSEIEKLREENKRLRESVEMSSCSNCGFSVTSRESQQCSYQILRIENVRLKAELEKIRGEKDKEYMAGVDLYQCVERAEENNSGEDVDSGIDGVKKSKIMEMVEEGVEELKTMATTGDPLWATNLETGREILNYDEYMKMFGLHNYHISHLSPHKHTIEASRDSAIVFIDVLQLVRSFIHVDLWKDMFPFIISKASVTDIVCEGEEDDNKNGITQLMFAELHMLTPLVPVREVYFVRHCRRIGIECWIIVDISIDRVKSKVDASLANCKKRPSGCIIEDKVNGHCKVIWVEHLECEKHGIPLMYRSIVNSGQAFGATHWISTLKLQCERLAFLTATNVPSKDTVGVNTLAGRKSILRLAQRMTRNFCHVLGASSNYTWMNTSEEKSDDIMKVASRRNLNYLGEPIGLLICVATSLWLPITPFTLFGFLKDNRTQWAINSNEGSILSIASLVKGQDRDNVVTIQGMAEEEGEKMWVIQDFYTNGKESMIVYASVDISKMKAIMEGCHSSDIAILPCGFSIMPDGIEPHPLLISTTREDKSMECGSLLTIAFQSHVGTCPQSKLTKESLECVSKLISITIQNIRRGLHCERR